MQHRFSKEEQNRARSVNLALFLTDYDIAYGTQRFSMDAKGYIHDTIDENWICSVKNNHWFDNSPKTLIKHGNAIDWVMYRADEQYSFKEAMTLLLAYADGNDWKQYLKNGDYFDELAEYPFT